MGICAGLHANLLCVVVFQSERDHFVGPTECRYRARTQTCAYYLTSALPKVAHEHNHMHGQRHTLLRRLNITHFIGFSFRVVQRSCVRRRLLRPRRLRRRRHSKSSSRTQTRPPKLAASSLSWYVGSSSAAAAAGGGGGGGGR